jgi:hypothetical protein
MAEGAFDPAQVAEALLGAPVDAVAPLQASGRNSRLYRVQAGAKTFCLKHYVARSGGDPRDRLGTEMGALALMESQGITCVPRPLARNTALGCALMSWVEGWPVDQPDERDIDAALEFLARIHASSRCVAAAGQPLASEACLSGAEIVTQLSRRQKRLAAAARDDAALAAFLERFSHFLAARILPPLEHGYRAMGQSVAEALPAGLRSLCPSDFGFHNALRDGGGLVFLDFDYFGWDDPVKLICDFLLHPGMELSEGLKRRFAVGARRVYGADGTFAPRLNLLFGLFALRWCLILLNEFLPERWAVRLHAGFQDDWARVKRIQLERAEKLFDLTESIFPCCPYDL